MLLNTRKKKNRVKFNPGLSANLPSNNWAPIIQNLLVITKSYGVGAITIEGQNAFAPSLCQCALRKLHVRSSQNTCDQITCDRRSKRARMLATYRRRMRSNNLGIRIARSSCRPQLQTRDCHTVEALMSGHPWDVEKVPVSEAGGRLREYKNTEFVWEFRKKGFCEGGRN